MSFAGVSVIADGKLLGAETCPASASAGAASGYHLLVLEGHSRILESIWSRVFTVGGYFWQILYKPDDAGYISLSLCLAKSTVDPVKAQFAFSLVEETDKQEPARIHGSKIFDFIVYTKYEYVKFVRREALEKSKHLKDNSFTIRCDIVVINPTWDTSPFIVVPPPDMPRNFTDLLQDGECTDVAFRVGGKTFAAHRCVLAARSPVFKAELFGPMKEGTAKADVVQIDDMDAAVFKALLEFIYGDSLPVPSDDEDEGHLLQHMLIAADRYDLRRLRAICEKRLCEHIDVGTATTFLALADQHGCDGLKKACYEFLRCLANLRAVVATEGFDHLCSSCPTLMKDMLLGVLPPK